MKKPSRIDWKKRKLNEKEKSIRSCLIKKKRHIMTMERKTMMKKQMIMEMNTETNMMMKMMKLDITMHLINRMHLDLMFSLKRRQLVQHQLACFISMEMLTRAKTLMNLLQMKITTKIRFLA